MGRSSTSASSVQAVEGSAASASQRLRLDPFRQVRSKWDTCTVGHRKSLISFEGAASSSWIMGFALPEPRFPELGMCADLASHPGQTRR